MSSLRVGGSALEVVGERRAFLQSDGSRQAGPQRRKTAFATAYMASSAGSSSMSARIVAPPQRSACPGQSMPESLPDRPGANWAAIGCEPYKTVILGCISVLKAQMLSLVLVSEHEQTRVRLL